MKTFKKKIGKPYSDHYVCIILPKKYAYSKYSVEEDKYFEEKLVETTWSIITIWSIWRPELSYACVYDA